MKKLLLLFLFIPCFAKAEGPLFNQKDTYVQQEFDNVYQNLRNSKSNTAILSQGTSGYSLIGGGSGNAPFWMNPRIVQSKECQVTTSSTSVATSFQPSNLTCSITPFYSTSKIYVSANATYRNDISSDACYGAIFRNTTNLMNSSFGGVEIQLTGTSSQNLKIPMTMAILDSPATTSATSYTVYLKRQTAGTTSNCILGDGLTQIIDLFEVGP